MTKTYTAVKQHEVHLQAIVDGTTYLAVHRGNAPTAERVQQLIGKAIGIEANQVIVLSQSEFTSPKYSGTYTLHEVVRVIRKRIRR